MTRLYRQRLTCRAGPLLAACILVAACTGAPPSAAQSGPNGAAITPIHIEARPLALDLQAPGDAKVGRLTYLAGYELVSEEKRFGGLSGLQVSPDGGELIALSDRGYWISMRLVQDGDKVTGIGEARLGVLGNRSAFPLTKREADSESLARDHDGSFLVGFEEYHRVWRYTPTPDRPGAEALSGTPSEFRMPGLLQRAKDNESLEDLTVLPDGKVLAILESPIPGEALNHAWLVDRQGGASDLYYDAKDNYSPTDLTVLPDGNLMVLERYFAPIFNVRARFRIVKQADIAPGAHLEGELIAELRPPLTVDNMEGIASRRASDGSTLIYVVSDDNFNAFQRTLLLEFRLEE